MTSEALSTWGVTSYPLKNEPSDRRSQSPTPSYGPPKLYRRGEIETATTRFPPIQRVSPTTLTLLPRLTSAKSAQ